MRLSRLYVEGFRSIEKLDLRFKPGKNVIIGRNNAGKSNIVKALDLVLGEASPAYAKSDNITENDFYCQVWTDETGQERDKACDEIVIWAELERVVGEELDWEQIDKCYGYNCYGSKSDASPIRLPAAEVQANPSMVFDHTEEGANYDKLYVSSKLKNQLTFREHLGPMHHFAFVLRATLTEDGVCKEIRFLYRESKEHAWILAFRCPIRTELMQSAILPAFRDPATQLRLSSWSWYGKLMRHLTKDAKHDEDFINAVAQMKNAGDKLFVGITSTLENDALSASFPDARLSIRFAGGTSDNLYKSCQLYVDDGYEGPLTDKGAGIQSATIIGLFSYYTRNVNTTAPALLCVEEPELYMHPHARRVISDRLDDFLDGGKNQVIVTTHGVEFLRTTSQNLNLILVKKSREEGTTAHALQAHQYQDVVVNNNQNEMFFADKVILCEGFDEYLIRAAAEELFPGALDRQNVSIVALDGKDRFDRGCQVVQALRMKCYLICDLDFLLRDKEKPADFEVKAHPSLEHLQKKFFSQDHVANAERPITKEAVKAMRDRLRSEEREAFYKGKTIADFRCPELREFLAQCRRCGVGVLDGEIEGLSRDEDWVRAGEKKFVLARVYDMRARISKGERVSDMFDLSPIEDVLRVVLDLPPRIAAPAMTSAIVRLAPGPAKTADTARAEVPPQGRAPSDAVQAHR